MGLKYLTRGGKVFMRIKLSSKNMPKKLINLLRVRQTAKRGQIWMRGQLTQMVKLNQGLISMSVGR